jgi:hypothetical protein
MRKLNPEGVMFIYEKGGSIFFCFIPVNFELKKVYGNWEIDADNLHIFDYGMNLISYDRNVELYEEVSSLVLSEVRDEHYEDDEEEEV